MNETKDQNEKECVLIWIRTENGEEPCCDTFNLCWEHKQA